MTARGDGPMTVQEQVLRIIAGQAATACHIGRSGLGAPRPDEATMDALFEEMQDLIDVSASELSEVIYTVIGSSVLATLDQLIARDLLTKREITDSEITEILNGVAAAVLKQPLRTESVVVAVPPEGMQ